MKLLTQQEIDKPYKDFILYYKNDEEYQSIGAIEIVIRAKSGWLNELFYRKILIQDPNRFNYFKINKEICYE